MNCGRKLAFLERERERDLTKEKVERERENEFEVGDSGEVGRGCIYSSRVKCLTPECDIITGKPGGTEMTKLPLLKRACYMPVHTGGNIVFRPKNSYRSGT